jgi:hypothetical protein
MAQKGLNEKGPRWTMGHQKNGTTRELKNEIQKGQEDERARERKKTQRENEEAKRENRKVGRRKNGVDKDREKGVSKTIKTRKRENRKTKTKWISGGKIVY